MSQAFRLQQIFSQPQKAFIPYLTIGDPSLADSKLYIKALVRAGASAIELGVPFSDPVADGPTIQRSSQRSLEKGTTLESVLQLVASLRKEGVTTPFIVFSYLNPIVAFGIERFHKIALAAGVDAVLILDLPPEEAALLKPNSLTQTVDQIFLASPTTSDERLQTIASLTTSFIYYVSRAGVTGEQSHMSQSLERETMRVKSITKKPIAVGFGISTPAHVAQMAALPIDGIIVGSALVRLIEEGSTPEQLEAFTKTLIQPLKDKAKE